jgi:hypothetical protein
MHIPPQSLRYTERVSAIRIASSCIRTTVLIALHGLQPFVFFSVPFGYGIHSIYTLKRSEIGIIFFTLHLRTGKAFRAKNKYQIYQFLPELSLLTQ